MRFCVCRGDHYHFEEGGGPSFGQPAHSILENQGGELRPSSSFSFCSVMDGSHFLFGFFKDDLLDILLYRCISSSSMFTLAMWNFLFLSFIFSTPPIFCRFFFFCCNLPQRLAAQIFSFFECDIFFCSQKFEIQELVYLKCFGINQFRSGTPGTYPPFKVFIKNLPLESSF